MIIRIRFGHWRSTFSLAPVTDIIGVNSNLPNGQHIIMWDFDDVELWKIKSALQWVQRVFVLPRIYILNTGTPNHYIAYCFEMTDWRDSIAVVAATQYVDANFFKYGVYRNHWTLRVGPKAGRKPKLVEIMEGICPENCSIAELNSWTQYETVNWDAKHPLKCPGCISPLRHCINLGQRE